MDKPPVSVYKATGFYRGGRWFATDSLSTIVRCNCSLPDGSDCEFVMAALSDENAETLTYGHLRRAHPDKVNDQAWSDTLGRELLSHG